MTLLLVATWPFFQVEAPWLFSEWQYDQIRSVSKILLQLVKALGS